MSDAHRHGRQGSRAFREKEVSWGNALYMGATALAGFIVLLAAGNYLYNIGQNRPLIPFIPLLIAAVVWAIGYWLHCLFDHR